MKEAPAILVLTDFFQAAGRALDYATNLAAPLGARLVLLHVRRDSLLDPDALSGELSNLSGPAVQLALDSLIHDLPLPVVAEIGHGLLLPAVADAVSRHHPVLIVLGRPNRDELPDELADTTALGILQHQPYPLLVVPPRLAHAASPRHLLLAVDGEPFTLGEFAGMARALLNSLHAELTVLHCAAHAPTDSDSAAAVLESVQATGLVLDLPPPRVLQIVASNPAGGILAAAQAARYDAVVVLARRRSVLGRLFHRSVTAQVLLHSQVPVLILPAE